MKILITGATGHLGSGIVKHVLELKKDEEISVSVRNVEKALELTKQGVDVRHGDFDDAASLDKAFKGIDRLVIVSTDGDTETRIRQHKTAIEAAKRAGVKLIVYTSLSKADNSPLNLAAVHKDTEARLIESGIDYIILRNNWYLENEIDTIKNAINTSTISSTLGNSKAGWMLRDDYAKAAAAAVLSNKVNVIYTLSNTLATIREFALALSKVTGKEIEVKDIDDQTLKGYLEAAGLPEGVAMFVTEMNKGIREGGLDAPSDDFEKLVGHKPRTLEEGLKALIATF